MLMLAIGTPYVINPGQMVDLMGHEQWSEWQAFDQIYPLMHSQRMLGLIAQFLASYKTSEGQNSTMPWFATEPPTSTEDRDKATMASLASLPGSVTSRVNTWDDPEEFIL